MCLDVAFTDPLCQEVIAFVTTAKFLLIPFHCSKTKKGAFDHLKALNVSPKSLHGIHKVCHSHHLLGNLTSLCGHQKCVLMHISRSVQNINTISVFLWENITIGLLPFHLAYVPYHRY